MEDPTLMIHWLFSCLALLVMGVRLVWRKVAKQAFNLGDYLTMGAIFCALVRLGLIHVVLTWGTNNMTAALRKTYVFTAKNIYQREVGSKLSIANRVFYNSYLWLQKLVLLDVYRRLLLNLKWEKAVIWSYLVVFFGTYVATQVTTFSECKPIQLYWQVVPDPGPCAAAQMQLIVVGVLNIVTDAMLLALPIPLVISLKTPWRRKMQLMILFTFGVFIIAITMIRLPINASNKNSQVNRTTWASTELLAAALVVNAPTLYGLWNLQRKAKSESRSKGTGERYWYGDGSYVSATRVGTQDRNSYMMSVRRQSAFNGIVQTKQVIVSEYIEPDKRGKGYANLGDDLDNVSRHSSQRGILRGSSEH